ncbi:putative kar3 protein [Zalerion maritima]|uniref:Kar3 protein n=1 Tax=Zalerion maritima TaxID=339359 RepID=A0AAD5WU63_9PEZI|nr:putative kar3 protein [Zalerion maritima]
MDLRRAGRELLLEGKMEGGDGDGLLLMRIEPAARCALSDAKSACERNFGNREALAGKHRAATLELGVDRDQEHLSPPTGQKSIITPSPIEFHSGVLLLASCVLFQQILIYRPKKKSIISTMDHHEITQTCNASKLRPPSQTRLPAFTASRPGATLTEITDSQTNRLNQQTMAPPPARKNLKHELNPPVTEPEPKRKTLADRAGEYPSSHGLSTSRPAVNGTTLMSGLSDADDWPHHSSRPRPRDHDMPTDISGIIGTVKQFWLCLGVETMRTNDGQRHSFNLSALMSDRNLNAPELPRYFQEISDENGGGAGHYVLTSDMIWLLKQPGSGLPAPRANSALPRNKSSNSNFSTTMGYGARPPSSSSNRPASQFSKSTYSRPRSKTHARPATAMSHHVSDDGPEAQPQGERNGTRVPFLVGSPEPAPSGIPRSVVRNIQPQHCLHDGFSQSLSGVPEVFGIKRGGRGTLLSLRSSTTNIKPETQVVSEKEASQVAASKENINPKVTVRCSNPRKTAISVRSPDAVPIQFPQTPTCSRASKSDDSKAAIAQLAMAAEELATPYKSSPHKASFLTKDTNTKGFIAWDVDERLTEFDSKLDVVKDLLNGSLSDKKLMEETIEFLKSKLSESESKNETLVEQLESARHEMHSLTLSLDTEKRCRQHDAEDRIRDHRNQMDELRRDLSDDAERQRREHREQLEATERHWKNTLEDIEAQKAREIQDLRAKLGSEQDGLNLEMSKTNRELENMRGQLEDVKGNLDRERTLKGNLSLQLSVKDTSIIQLEAHNRSLQARIDFLESGSKSQSDSFAKMESELRGAERVRDEWKEKLIREETERRILFNKYQELKGNIRVMCRVRPPLGSSEGEAANIRFPDEKTSAEIQVMGPEEKSSLGNVSRKTNTFEYDRVFAPGVQNEEVFGEISQLVQSALDGYNVCIFCYGQTGSGKTYTMSSTDGMIPRATHMIYETMTKLKDKNWSYSMQGCFVEVYNEELHDLLGDNGKKLEIRHDEQRKKTSVTNCSSVSLDSVERVESILERAQKNRSVAATKANEHSSRSHSVFILRISGENSTTGERCEGTLNLVDLAGSERLKHSQAEGDRMKETQNINKSLSSLGDVIEALGSKAKHVPYRNSKLTHLLQYSLGGSSKTLMFVMVSPLETHLQETLASLKFATKVHNTHIGTAKTTKKVGAKPRSSDS